MTREDFDSMHERKATESIRRRKPFASPRRTIRVAGPVFDGRRLKRRLRVADQTRGEEVDIDYVVVCDDRAVVRLGLEAMLRSEVPTLEVRAVTSLSEAREISEGKAGRGLLFVGGRKATSDLGDLGPRPPNVRFVLLLPDSDPARLRRAAALDVSGYLVEDALKRSSIRSVLLDVGAGNFPMPGAMADVLLGRTGTDRRATKMQLSDLQLQVLELLAAGATNKFIATTLGVPLHSVKRQVTKLLTVLQCGNRTTAATKAIQIGLISPDKASG